MVHHHARIGVLLPTVGRDGGCEPSLPFPQNQERQHSTAHRHARVGVLLHRPLGRTLHALSVVHNQPARAVHHRRGPQAGVGGHGGMPGLADGQSALPGWGGAGRGGAGRGRVGWGSSRHAAPTVVGKRRVEAARHRRHAVLAGAALHRGCAVAPATAGSRRPWQRLWLERAAANAVPSSAGLRQQALRRPAPCSKCLAIPTCRGLSSGAGTGLAARQRAKGRAPALARAPRRRRRHLGAPRRASGAALDWRLALWGGRGGSIMGVESPWVRHSGGGGACSGRAALEQAPASPQCLGAAVSFCRGGLNAAERSCRSPTCVREVTGTAGRALGVTCTSQQPGGGRGAGEKGAAGASRQRWPMGACRSCACMRAGGRCRSRE